MYMAPNAIIPENTILAWVTSDTRPEYASAKRSTLESSSSGESAAVNASLKTKPESVVHAASTVNAPASAVDPNRDFCRATIPRKQSRYVIKIRVQRSRGWCGRKAPAISGAPANF